MPDPQPQRDADHLDEWIAFRNAVIQHIQSAPAVYPITLELIAERALAVLDAVREHQPNAYAQHTAEQQRDTIAHAHAVGWADSRANSDSYAYGYARGVKHLSELAGRYPIEHAAARQGHTQPEQQPV